MFFDSPDKQIREFEARINPFTGYLYNLAYRISGNQHDAEDIVQEVLVKMYRQFKRWRDADNPRAYFARAIYNQYVDNIRKQSRHNQSVDIEDEVIQADENTANAPDLATDKDMTLDRVTQALQSLSEDHRSVIVLHDIEGYTYEEIGDIMDIAVGTAKSRHSRARRALGELL